jgi:hypothetical protein
MARKRSKAKQAGEEGDEEPRYDYAQQGPDPNFRLLALHPAEPLCAVAVGGHLRVLNYRCAAQRLAPIAA